MSRTKGYKCFNIKCGSCIGKTLCGEPEDTALGCSNRVVGKKPTNADRIRSMSDEELAEFISSIPMCVGEDEDLNCEIDVCKECFLKWLQRQAEEADHA